MHCLQPRTGDQAGIAYRRVWTSVALAAVKFGKSLLALSDCGRQEHSCGEKNQHPCGYKDDTNDDKVSPAFQPDSRRSGVDGSRGVRSGRNDRKSADGEAIDQNEDANQSNSHHNLDH